MGMLAQVVLKPRRVLGLDDAAEYVNGPQNLRRLLDAGWLKALPGKRRGMDYDLRDLDLAVDRVRLEGWPEGKSISES
jgi:hypothetical protein